MPDVANSDPLGDLGLRLALHAVLIGGGLAQRIRFQLGSHTLCVITGFRHEFSRLTLGGAADLLRLTGGGPAGPRRLVLRIVQQCQHWGQLGRRVSAAVCRNAGTSGGARCAGRTDAVHNVSPLRHRVLLMGSTIKS
jgi:hypothetical protein